MNLPNVIEALVKAQDSFNSLAYADCFSQLAIVFDEGAIHTGRIEIKDWIEKSNKEYQTVMKPLEYSEDEKVLKAKISGNFEGSPIILRYHFEFEDGLIKSLKIKG